MPQGSGPGYILPLCVIVSDAYDSFVIATVNITSSPPDASDLTPDALESLLDDAVEAPLQSGDVDAALGALISIMDTVQDSNTSGEFCKTCVLIIVIISRIAFLMCLISLCDKCEKISPSTLTNKY